MARAFELNVKMFLIAEVLILVFALDKCQQIMPNMYKCPAIDQPICTPEFTRTDVSCVRVGPKGSVFVTRPGFTQ